MSQSQESLSFEASHLVRGDSLRNKEGSVFPVLASDVPLSFWGGIDEKTGVVIDTSHPLHGTTVAGTILILPSGRGSCTGSQVLLELILNHKAPKALVLRDRDGLACVGALIAQSVFPEQKEHILDILQIRQPVEVEESGMSSDNTAGFDALIRYQPKYGTVQSDGTLIVGKTQQEVLERVQNLIGSSFPNENRTSMEDFVWSTEENDMLEQAETDAERRAVECLVRYARIVSPSVGDPKYVDVEQAHIDGCTYIGPGGLHFVQRLVQDGGRVKVPTTLNSVSTDLRYWKRLGIVPTESQQNSIALAEAYLALGCSEHSFTCAPYLLDNAPILGQQIVWGESNAVVYSNTVLGARTEKYADYLDICAAIVGKVPAVGVHLKECRKPKILLTMENVDLETKDKDTFQMLFPVLGHLCGSLSDGEVPLLIGMEKYADAITTDHLKAFCAAFGTTAASPLIHIAGVTPEAKSPTDVEELLQSCHRRMRRITTDDLEATFTLLDQQKDNIHGVGGDRSPLEDNQQIDWVAIGNPHLSLSECDELLRLVEDQVPQGTPPLVSMIACMSRVLYDKSPAVKKLEDFGVKFVRDTCWCMLLEPPMIPSDPSATILTNSGKYAHYGPGLTGRKFRLGNMRDCVQAAWSGTLPRRSPSRDVPWASGNYRSFSTRASTTNSGRVDLRSALRFLKTIS